MKRLVIEMPEVLRCAASQCLYNTNGACHAKAITVGNALSPDCDTFLDSKVHARNIQLHAGVGACKVSGCRYNQDFECTAGNGIEVGFASSQVRCLTFEPRR
jgi:hypothetical protein